MVKAGGRRRGPQGRDLEGFTFVCRLKPKTEFGGTKVTGTCVDHDTIEALPGQEEELSDEEEADMETARC